jgi:hypothetical protein
MFAQLQLRPTTHDQALYTGRYKGRKVLVWRQTDNTEIITPCPLVVMALRNEVDWYLLCPEELASNGKMELRCSHHAMDVDMELFLVMENIGMEGKMGRTASDNLDTLVAGTWSGTTAGETEQTTTCVMTDPELKSELVMLSGGIIRYRGRAIPTAAMPSVKADIILDPVKQAPALMQDTIRVAAYNGHDLSRRQCENR